MKKTFTPQEKAAVALAALKGDQTTAQISSIHEVHPTQVGIWKKQAQTGLQEIFSDKRRKVNQTQEQLIAELYQTVGRRDMELAWLKKKLQPYVSSG